MAVDMNSTRIHNCSSEFFLVLLDNLEFFQTIITISVWFNIVLVVLATAGNTLIIFTILTSKNLQSPSYLLITSLLCADFLVGSLYQPYFTFNLILVLLGKRKIICEDSKFFIDAAMYIVFYSRSVSFVMDAFISIDRYLALSLKHRYKAIVTKRKALVSILGCWFGVPITQLYRTLGQENIDYVSVCISLASVAIATVAYTLSFKKIKQISGQVNIKERDGTFNLVRYKKTLITMVTVLGVFLVSSLGSIIGYGYRSIYGYTRTAAVIGLISVMFQGLYCAINPVIFLTRFTDIQRQCKRIVCKS